MPTTPHCSYDSIKLAICKKHITSIDLEDFKMLFKNEIQSTRRYATIKTLYDLLDCLERRDCLSEQNINPLRILSKYFADDEIDIALEKYRPPEDSNELENIYALQRNQERIAIKSEFNEKPPQTEQKPTVVIEFSQKKRDDVYSTIVRNIGKDWLFFGRELSIRAGDLDKIEAKYPNDLHSRIYEVFKVFEEDNINNPNEHYNIICKALGNCRRKDVRRLVEKIMSY